MSRDARIRSSGFLTTSETNRSIQSQGKARSLECRMLEEEGLYYPCIENKGADQLCSYCTVDLRLCNRRGKNPGLS